MWTMTTPRTSRRAISCLGWALVAVLLTVATVAWAQQGPVDHPVDTTQQVALLLGLPAPLVWAAQNGGLPLVLAALAWWARGSVGKLGGIPVVVTIRPPTPPPPPPRGG